MCFKFHFNPLTKRDSISVLLVLLQPMLVIGILFFRVVKVTKCEIIQ